MEEKFSSRRLSQFQKEMAGTFFLPGEFPTLDRGEEPKEAVEAAKSVASDEYREYALSLPGRAVENLLLALPRADEEETRHILTLLDMRMSSRLVGLLWALYQHYPDCRPVCYAVRTMGGYAPESSLLSMTRLEEDKISAVTRILISEGGDIEEFSRKYLLLMDSPFAKKVFNKFFSLCAIEMIEKNSGYFRGLLENETGEGFLAAVKNYLSQMDRTREMEDINILLLSRLGKPGYSPFWHEIDGRMVARFESWNFAHELRHHFKEGSKKMELLSRYTRFIKEIVSDEDGVIRINFGRFVLLDGGNRDEDSFYIAHPGRGMKADYRELWENRRKFGSAKNFILEAKESPILRLSYYETGTLFTGEMLDILLGLKLDMRKKNIEGAEGGTPAPLYDI